MARREQCVGDGAAEEDGPAEDEGSHRRILANR
jgi:hypothetical protein